MFTKLMLFIRSQRFLTKIAATASIVSVGLGFYAVASYRPFIMAAAGAIAGVAAGFAVGTLRQAMRRSGGKGTPEDRRGTPDRRHDDHHTPQLTAHS